MRKSIWQPIQFDLKWNAVNTETFDNLYPSWVRKRAELKKEPKEYERFMNQLKRKQAIDTGILEQMYDLKRGVTETFIQQGFVESYLQHGDTNIASGLLMEYLQDNFRAMDFVFAFVKNDRDLSVSYIKELHQLITLHQEYTEAVDSLGNRIRVPLLKGKFKQYPNNPEREGMIYTYCPPEQVDSEMDALIQILRSEAKNSHVLVKAAFLHHALAQIHPFQDGNGRIARLLASLMLIREELFPLTLDREERSKYIDALERADAGEYQPLVDVLASNQIASIRHALNRTTISHDTGYESVLQTFEKKLQNYRTAEEERRNQRILVNMKGVFAAIQEKMESLFTGLQEKLGKDSLTQSHCPPEGSEEFWYSKQIGKYAKQHNYFANLSLHKGWSRFVLKIDRGKVYHLVVSLHHYGYDNSTFAIGAFLSRPFSESAEAEKDTLTIPLGIPPLTISSEQEVSRLVSSVHQQVDACVMTALTAIMNELG
jgi:Fic family protein